jgi:hypothetical protein
MSDADEIVQTIGRLEARLEELTVRGLRSAGPEQLAALTALREEFERIGADHLAGRVADLVAALRSDDPKAAAALLRTQASLRVFERILTLEAAAEALRALLPEEEEKQA